MNLFVYGTLLFPEIRYALLSKETACKPAVLENYAAVTFYYDKEEMEYPILKKATNQETHGLLIYDLNQSDMKILSYYEGDDYVLEKIKVIVDGKSVESHVFSVKHPEQITYGSIWNKKNFAIQNLHIYVHTEIPKMLLEIQQTPS